jgi:hypothetical protein
MTLRDLFSKRKKKISFISIALLAVLLASGALSATIASGFTSTSSSVKTMSPLSSAYAKFSSSDPAITSSMTFGNGAAGKPNCVAAPAANPFNDAWGPGPDCGACPTPHQDGFPNQPTVACWSSSFTLPKSVDYYTTTSTSGQTCPCVVNYAIIGTNPQSSDKTTTVPVNMIPISVNFGGQAITLDGSSDVASTVTSPLFQTDSNYGMGGANLQFNDAMFRAQFWGTIQRTRHTGFNVVLGNPNVGSTFSTTLPANTAPVCTSTTTTAFGDGCGAVYDFCGATSCQLVGVIDPTYFELSILQPAVDSHTINPAALSIFLTSDIVLGDPLNIMNYCCIIGFHGWDQTGPSFNGQYFTFAWASYTDPNFNNDVFGVPITDINALSHEIGEWMSDPWTNNALPYAWSVNNQPQYGCSPILEVGDPLVGIVIPTNGYNPQDLAYYSWFAQQNPSIGFSLTGSSTQYDYLGALGNAPPDPNVCNTG